MRNYCPFPPGFTQPHKPYTKQPNPMTTIVGVDCHSYFRVVAQGAGNTLYGTSTTHSVNM